MNWNRYKVFYYVCKYQSFAKAAEELSTSPASISRQISDFEAKYKVKLFIRTSSGVELSERAKEIYGVVKSMHANIEVADSLLTELEQGIAGLLKIHTTPSLASFWLVDLLSDFAHSYPKIRLRITGDFNRKELDGPEISIRTYEANNPELMQLRITTFKMCMFASKKYLDHYGRPSKVNDLSSHKFAIIPNIFDANPNWIFKVMDQIVTDDNIMMEINSAHGLLVAAQNHIGIVELPLNYSGLDTSDLEIVLPEIEPPQVDLYLAFPHYHRNNRKIKLLTSFLKSKIKNNFE